jgi:hypothetical protein
LFLEQVVDRWRKKEGPCTLVELHVQPPVGSAHCTSQTSCGQRLGFAESERDPLSEIGATRPTVRSSRRTTTRRRQPSGPS